MGAHWAGKHICFQSDSMAVVSALNQRAAKSLPYAHAYCISLWSVFYGFELEAIHISGSLNGVADALSQNKAEFILTLMEGEMIPWKFFFLAVHLELSLEVCYQ